MFALVILVMLSIGIALFKDVNMKNVKKSAEISNTFPLPKVNQKPMEYVIDGMPYEFETPNSDFNKVAIKMPVKDRGAKGEIFIGKSLEFQLAVEMEKMNIKPTIENFEKLVGKTIKIWMTMDNTNDNEYYHCSIHN